MKAFTFILTYSRKTFMFSLLLLLCFLIPFLSLYLCSLNLKWFHEKNLYLMIAVSLGFLFSVLFKSFLPTVYDHSTPYSSYLICLGILFILFIEYYVADHIKLLKFFSVKAHQPTSTVHEHHRLVTHKHSCSSIGCILVCGFFDGIEIATGMSLSLKAGLFTLLGLSTHILSDSLLISSLTLSSFLKKKDIFFVSFLMGLSLALGVLLASFLKNIIDFKSYILPFASGILIYICLGHLLPSVLKHRYGFLTLLVSFIISSNMH